MILASRDYEEGLVEDLKVPEEATEYLNAALEEDDKEVFLLALKQVTMAQGGITKIAKNSN